MNRSLLIVILALGVSNSFSLSAFAESGLVNLKQIQVSPGARQIDLLFDGKVASNQIRTEYINDVIQLSLMDVGVYPAKISAVNGGDVTKIFAYQYTPRLVRTRLTVRGKADSYRDRVQVVPAGKILTIRFGDHAGVRATAMIEEKRSAAHPANNPERAVPFDPAEDKALLERVMKGAPQPAPETKAPAASERKAEQRREDRRLGGARPGPNPFSGLWKLAMVLAGFGAIAWAARRWMPQSLKSSIKAMRKKAGMVEVISTQSLGPKKSISVVRVNGVTLVLGVTNESINLISRIDGETETGLDDASLSQLAIDELGQGNPPASTPIHISSSAVRSASAGFSDYLKQVAPAEATQPQVTLDASRPLQSDVRNRIRNRLEGLKPL